MLIGSNVLAKKVKKRIQKEYLKRNPIDDTFTELIYNPEHHHKKLTGLFSR
jgi:hypothetical protein